MLTPRVRIGDPIGFNATYKEHANVMDVLRKYVDEDAGRRMLVMGGGGYNHLVSTRHAARTVACLQAHMLTPAQDTVTAWAMDDLCLIDTHIMHLLAAARGNDVLNRLRVVARGNTDALFQIQIRTILGDMDQRDRYRWHGLLSSLQGSDAGILVQVLDRILAPGFRLSENPPKKVRTCFFEAGSIICGVGTFHEVTDGRSGFRRDLVQPLRRNSCSAIRLVQHVPPRRELLHTFGARPPPHVPGRVPHAERRRVRRILLAVAGVGALRVTPVGAAAALLRRGRVPAHPGQQRRRGGRLAGGRLPQRVARQQRVPHRRVHARTAAIHRGGATVRRGREQPPDQIQAPLPDVPHPRRRVHRGRRQVGRAAQLRVPVRSRVPRLRAQRGLRRGGAHPPHLQDLHERRRDPGARPARRVQGRTSRARATPASSTCAAASRWSARGRPAVATRSTPRTTP